jgi:hypothetical protein
MSAQRNYIFAADRWVNPSRAGIDGRGVIDSVKQSLELPETLRHVS